MISQRPLVVLPGVLVRDRFGAILDASSTVTLVKTGDSGNILIDSGERSRREELLDGLLTIGRLEPEDIHILINTHGHADHTGSNELFTRAKWIAHEDEFIVKSKKTSKFRKASEGCVLSNSPRTYIIGTPGHTAGSITVIVEAEDVYAVTGDALPIRDNYRNWVPPGINIDPELALRSMAHIVEIADFIIPGHDEGFRINK